LELLGQPFLLPIVVVFQVEELLFMLHNTYQYINNSACQAELLNIIGV
jgi:hypothetical protein